MKCIQYTQVLEYVDCADWILFLDEEERRAAEVLSSRGKQKFITDRNILEKINLMIADKYFKELKDQNPQQQMFCADIINTPVSRFILCQNQYFLHARRNGNLIPHRVLPR